MVVEKCHLVLLILEDIQHELTRRVTQEHDSLLKSNHFFLPYLESHCRVSTSCRDYEIKQKKVEEGDADRRIFFNLNNANLKHSMSSVRVAYYKRFAAIVVILILHVGVILVQASKCHLCRVDHFEFELFDHQAHGVEDFTIIIIDESIEGLMLDYLPVFLCGLLALAFVHSAVSYSLFQASSYSHLFFFFYGFHLFTLSRLIPTI